LDKEMFFCTFYLHGASKKKPETGTSRSTAV
jgi:hypothetical protein